MVSNPVGRMAMLAVTLCVALPASAQGVSPPLTVFSAGSAKGVLTAILARYRQETGETVVEVAGSAGLMLDRIEAGEAADVFVSANMGYARQLTREGKGTPTVVFALNQLCAIAVPGVGLTGGNIVDRLLDPNVRLGSSNPKNDPSGQYAFAVFDRADALHPGAAAILKAKDKIGGGAPVGAPVVKRNAAESMAARGVDMMVSFCSSSDATPDTSVTRVELPANLAVPVAFGMTVLTKAGDPARRAASDRLAAYLMSAPAQAILATYGFRPAGAVARDQL